MYCCKIINLFKVGTEMLYTFGAYQLQINWKLGKFAKCQKNKKGDG